MSTLIIKSRFVNIIPDFSHLFEPLYLSKMVNTVLRGINFQICEEHEEHDSKEVKEYK